MIEGFQDPSTYRDVNRDSHKQKQMLPKKFDEFLVETEEIRLFANESLAESRSAFPQNAPQITEERRWNSHY